MTHISEASELSRMNWWTAEYGLVGSLDNPRIFGAGLLSSVGESRWCLSNKVKKIPLTLDCIKMGYDITEPQPHLFVTPDFKTLTTVLDEMSNQMAYKVGGLKGLTKAIDAKSINTAELNSGLQISGVLQNVVATANGEPCYLQFQGPTQLSFRDQELPGHDKAYHQHGFGTPVGFLKQFPDRCPSLLTEQEWISLGVRDASNCRLEFVSGVVVTGTLKSRLTRENKTLLLVLENAKASLEDKIFFDPSWGTFDMALGTSVPSVFGGPADRVAYGESEDFVAKRVQAPHYSARELTLHKQYADLRKLRETQVSGKTLVQALTGLLFVHDREFPQDWLLRLEAVELMKARAPKSDLLLMTEKSLTEIAALSEKNKDLISDGLRLSGAL